MRDSPYYLSFLDNETYLELEDQHQKQHARQQTQQVIQQVASSSGQTASVLRSIYQGASSLLEGAQNPPPMPPPPPQPAPAEVNGNGNGSEFYSIGSPPGSPEVVVPEKKNTEVMDVDDFLLTLNVLPPSTMVPQVNVPPNVSSTKIDWSKFEGLYPSIEGGSSSSSSAPASQLAIENVYRTL